MKQELDVQAFYAAVESKKSAFGVTWSSLATQLELGDEAIFLRLARGEAPEANALLTLSGWLGTSLDTFARGDVTAPDTRQHAMDAINSYLRVDETMAPESREAIDSVLRAAYDQLERQQQESDSAHPAASPD